MQTVIDFINTYLTVLGVPGTRVLGVAAIITLALILSRLLSRVLLRYIQRLTRRITATPDDGLAELLQQPISWLIVLGGFWVAYLSLTEYLSPELSDFFQQFMNLALIVIVALIAYRSASLAAAVLQKLAPHTMKGLDDLVVPYIPKFIKIVAVAIVVVKIAEVLLGMSATAFVGLLGGAGITLGLVFKDILSDWFASVLIRVDKLYKAGDVIEMGDGAFATVDGIGLRSSVVRMFAGPVVRIPNSQMVNAGTRNWSQAQNWLAEYKLRLDGVSSEEIERVIHGVREILKSEEGVDQEWHLVHLNRIEGNSRVIKIEYYPDSRGLYESEWLDVDKYYDRFSYTIEKVNLAILALLEREQIDPLTYTLFGNVRDHRQRTPLASGRDEEETIESLLVAEQRRTPS